MGNYVSTLDNNGITISGKTVGSYMKRWGLKSPELVEESLLDEYFAEDGRVLLLNHYALSICKKNQVNNQEGELLHEKSSIDARNTMILANIISVSTNFVHSTTYHVVADSLSSDIIDDFIKKAFPKRTKKVELVIKTNPENYTVESLKELKKDSKYQINFLDNKVRRYF